MRTVVISGANRGIGLELAKYFVLKGDRVIATARNPDHADELLKIQREYSVKLVIEALDVQSDVSCKGLARKCDEYGAVDILINNAGVFLDPDRKFNEVDPKVLINTIDVNTVGPVRMCQSFLPLLMKSKKPVVANITSKMGSIADNTSGGDYAYRMSKAALNMFNRSFSIDYPNIISVLFHPGWVQTDMGGSAAPVQVDESASGIGKVIDGFKKEDSGCFLDFRGKVLPW